jgi:DNA-binding NtrC family response regulator
MATRVPSTGDGSPRILLIDDDEQFRAAMKKQLEVRDYEVWDTDNGEDAIKLIRVSNPEVVILDQKMPKMDGMQTLKEIKKIRPEAQVIMLTGFGSAESAWLSGKYDVFHYMQKPCVLNDLIEVIDAACKERMYATARHKMPEVRQNSVKRWFIGTHIGDWLRKRLTWVSALDWAVEEGYGGKKMQSNKINLLIVDDEERFLESIKKRLEVRDFNVITVNRGEKALEAARKNPIDVALVDLKMPGMDGEQTLAALKKEHKWMEVVILTGHGSTESAVECTKKGAYFYLQKPCELDRLLSVLIDAYKRRVMNKKKIKEERMDEVLQMADSSSPLAILRRIKQLDQEEG